MKRKINLQLFAEGGAGAGASAGNAGSNGSGVAGMGVVGESPAPQGEDLSQVVYGKSDQTLAQSNDVTTANDIKPEDRQKAFDNMIKKGGEYAEEFNKRTQDIINKRFKETKGLEETLKSYDPIMGLLAAKYGLDAKDVKGIEKAINDDTSLFEEAAFKAGLSAEQYRDKLRLEQENAQLKAAEEARKAQINSDKIYSQWLEDAEKVSQMYGRSIDLATECQNDEFTGLLAAGVDFETAYKAIHINEMLNGAMAATAANVEQSLINKATSYASRPVENGGMSSSTKVFKSDVSKFTDADMREIARRVEAGERICL